MYHKTFHAGTDFPTEFEKIDLGNRIFHPLMYNKTVYAGADFPGELKKMDLEDPFFPPVL